MATAVTVRGRRRGDFRVTDPVRAERDAGRRYILAAALRDPRFAGFCALATSIAAMNAVVPGHESIVARCAKFIVTALLLATFFLLLTILTPRTEEESRTAGRRARNSMFALAAVFVAMSVLVAILR